ncbi:Xaa-Pro peptidase family protein, partial [Candidatus Woesearchaeota archaeon]|nr:Xaa-Pro peptidase family protein [Candidatus Woesearchaeota archaeon]
NKGPKLFIPLLDIEKAFKSGTKFEIVRKNFYEKMKKFAGRPKIIGIEEKKFSIYAMKKLKKIFKNAKFRDISQIIFDLRKIKTQKEIKIIREASAITNNILNSCIRNLKKFKTEKDIEEYLKIQCIKTGVEPAFEFVVASGRNPATPHHTPSNKKISKGFCVLDFGVRYKGYCTDITRTVYIGKPSKREKELYNLVLSVQEKAIKNVKLGKKFSEMDQEARQNFGKKAKYFIHSLGHGVGLEVHEMPHIGNGSEEAVENNMYFTVEPGIYLIGRLGIRIEDDILVVNGKVENLTKVRKQLITV